MSAAVLCKGCEHTEYLELRFTKPVRIAATLIYIVQTILYTGVVVYAPALALNQVTGFDLWGSVFATGIVCSFYCTLGGLKAVVWTDAFQLIVMVTGFLTVLIQGTLQNGGPANIWENANNGSRLSIFDFDVDPLRRHTFWTISIGGTFTWLGMYGVNQSTMQRCISCKSEKHAKLALYLNLVGLWIILVCAVFSGLVMYTHFRSCDPWTAGFISAPDQLMPYFVMIIFSSAPGLPGLFVACAFSGTLSTVAASINALATVTFEDFVKHCFPNISERMGTWISKGLCIIFGVICTSMAVAASLMGGVVQASLSIHGMCGGPMLGLFILGIVFPCANWKGALGGLLIGIILAFWVGIGAFVYPAPPSKTLPLYLSTAGCIANNTETVATVIPTLPPVRPHLADTWYSLSYLYYSAVGCLGCIIAGLLISFVTGPNKGRDIKPLLIRPVCNIFCFWSHKCKALCWCGVAHDNKAPQEESKQDLQKELAKNVEANDALKNGLNTEMQKHLPGYNPGEKSYTNTSIDAESYF
ncbi:sodium-coupled monocarboxylate transporter 2 isoform X2 [Hemicordylus capensis]|uniref:sodium-coupled monocarboxylate transporter 2 isoform X2 n=1 Tax=Hemicordylus capensis TaxID=884348 RepID=UPI002303A62B|nr:sodium-coupled monocarboxylate transporter 2 isoform X2 [Hemicordylus capensis]